MAKHSSILVWRIPWTEEPGGATVRGVTRSRTQLKQLRLFHLRQDRGLTQHWGGVEDGMHSPGGDISKARSADVGQVRRQRCCASFD